MIAVTCVGNIRDMLFLRTAFVKFTLNGCPRDECRDRYCKEEYSAKVFASLLKVHKYHIPLSETYIICIGKLCLIFHTSCQPVDFGNNHKKKLKKILTTEILLKAERM